MRGRKGTSDKGHQGIPPAADGSVTCPVSCTSLFPPVFWWALLRIHEFVMHALFLQVKHLGDNRSMGKYQLLEQAACLPGSFAPVFFLASEQLVIRRESNNSAAVQWLLALNTSSIHQMGKSACNKQKYFLTQILAFYKLWVSFPAVEITVLKQGTVIAVRNRHLRPPSLCVPPLLRKFIGGFTTEMNVCFGSESLSTWFVPLFLPSSAVLTAKPCCNAKRYTTSHLLSAPTKRHLSREMASSQLRRP